MSKRWIGTSVDIDADLKTVWQILMDFPAYPNWNPFIRSIEGEAHQGSRLSVLIQPPGQKPMRFRPLVQATDGRTSFGWIGNLLVRGLFDGHHQFELQPHGRGTRLLHRESFSGLLVPLVWSRMESSTRAGFDAMNRALKARAETPAGKD